MTLQYVQQRGFEIPKFWYFIIHFFWLTKVDRYSLIHLCQNMLVADCTFFHLVLYFLSNWLKFRGGKFCEGEPNIKWLGVLASKLSTLSLVGVSGRWLITDSTSHRKVVNESSVNARYRVITLNARFTNLTKDSQTPPIHGLMGGLNFHSMFCLLIMSIILS